MNWGRYSATLLFGLLCSVNFHDSASGAAAAGLQGSRARESLRRSGAVTPSLTSQNSVSNEQNTSTVASKIGLLAEGSSVEKERPQGVLERQRRESTTADSTSSETTAQESRPKEEDGELKKCSAACKNDWLGDGWCDTACNTEACEFDGGDCKGWCSGDCKPSWQGDGFCDAACYVAACDWDGEDCKEWKKEGVQPIDRRTLQQKEKQLKQHRLQLPDCKCKRRLLVNGACTPECNTPECLFDGGECLDMCNAKCAKSWLGDGDCDKDCDTPECGYDKGDCDGNTNPIMTTVTSAANSGGKCSSSCRLWMIANSVCDTQCNNASCGFDGGDCDNVSVVLEVDYSAKPEVYQFCAKEWIGDGHCDPNCYNKPSKWDGGDCEGTPLEKEQAEKGIGPQFN